MDIKESIFRQALYEADPGFTELIIAESRLRDKQFTEAIQAYEKCLDLIEATGKNKWILNRAKGKLSELKPDSKRP